MQVVELRERLAAGADFFQARLVLRSPRVGEIPPVDGIAKGLKEGLRFAGDRTAPVDQCPEHIEEQRFGHGHDTTSKTPLRRKQPARSRRAHKRFPLAQKLTTLLRRMASRARRPAPLAASP